MSSQVKFPALTVPPMVRRAVGPTVPSEADGKPAPPLGERDFRNLARVISVCTLGLWAFAIGLLIGVFLFR